MEGLLRPQELQEVLRAGDRPEGQLACLALYSDLNGENAENHRPFTKMTWQIVGEKVRIAGKNGFF